MRGADDVFAAVVFLNPLETEVGEDGLLAVNVVRLGADDALDVTVEITDEAGAVVATQTLDLDEGETAAATAIDVSAAEAGTLTATLAAVDGEDVGIGTDSVEVEKTEDPTPPPPSGPNPGFTGRPGQDGLYDQQEIALLYEVAFARQPDIPGLDFWINKVYEEDGFSVVEIADFFYDSDPFEAAIGADPDTLTDAELVEELYSNVLDREGLASENDPDGFDFWLGVAGDGATGGELMRFFAISEENVDNSPYVDDLALSEDGSWSF